MDAIWLRFNCSDKHGETFCVLQVTSDGAAVASLAYTPVVVLSTGDGKWNTGVWPGYGAGKVVVLNWAAAGVIVNKTSCPFECEFTHDQRRMVS